MEDRMRDRLWIERSFAFRIALAALVLLLHAAGGAPAAKEQGVRFTSDSRRTSGHLRDPRPASLLESQDELPDIATFLQIGQATPAGYSWDGEDVYFLSQMSGATQVYRLTAEGWPMQLSFFEDGIEFFHLSRGGGLAIVGASTGGSELAQLYLMDTQSGRLVALTHFDDVQAGSVVWSLDDREIYYRSNEENKRDFFIYRMDVATGERARIFGETGGVDGYNEVAADPSPDGRTLIISHATSSANNDLYLLDLASGASRKLTEDDEDVLYGSPAFLADNRTLLLTCNANPDGIARLARMTIDSPKVEFVDDGWLDPRWEIDALTLSRDVRHLAAFVNEDGYVRMHARDLERDAALPDPPLAGMLGGGMADRQGRFLLSFVGPTRAPDVWRWDPRAERLEQLTFATYAGIDRERFQEPRLVRYRNFDDLMIPAFLYLPAGYAGGPIPFLIDAHGGPEGQARPAFQRNIQYLLLHGYGLLAPNPRGSTGYGRDYLNLDNYKNRESALRDYKAAADWLIDEGYTEPRMLGIRGGSYGGFVVLAMIAGYPELFAAAVENVGIANFQTFLENTSAYRRALREAEYGPLSDPEFLASISPIHKADRIRTPLFVVHGVNDPRVPIGEARQIIAAIRDRGGAVDSLIFADEGHGTGKRDNTIVEYRRQMEFFDRYLKAAK